MLLMSWPSYDLLLWCTRHCHTASEHSISIECPINDGKISIMYAVNQSTHQPWLELTINAALSSHRDSEGSESDQCSQHLLIVVTGSISIINSQCLIYLSIVPFILWILNHKTSQWSVQSTKFEAASVNLHHRKSQYQRGFSTLAAAGKHWFKQL